MILIALILLGCNPNVREVVDIHGYKYRLVSSEKVISDTISQVEIWERVNPLDTNHWYTPTASSRLNTNQVMMFQTLMR